MLVQHVSAANSLISCVMTNHINDIYSTQITPKVNIFYSQPTFFWCAMILHNHALMQHCNDLQPAPTLLGFLLGLSDAVHSADGLQLMRRVEDGLDEQHVRCLDDIQPVWASVQGEQEDVDLFIVLEGAQVLLESMSNILSYKPSVHRKSRSSTTLAWRDRIWPAVSLHLAHEAKQNHCNSDSTCTAKTTNNQ